jgi:hypothetical protein
MTKNELHIEKNLNLLDETENKFLKIKKVDPWVSIFKLCKGLCH